MDSEIIKKPLIRGLKVSIPLLITLLIVFWTLKTIESLFHDLLKPFVPEAYYFTGLGAIIGLCVVYLIGLSIEARVTQWMHSWVEEIIERVPGVKWIYRSIKDLIGLLTSDQGQKMGEPVLVQFNELQLLGFVTRQDFTDFEPNQIKEGTITVYFPFSCQLGGYTLFIPRSLVTPLNLNVQDALKFAFTAGLAKMVPPK